MDISHWQERPSGFDPEIVKQLFAPPIRPRSQSYGSESFPITPARLQASRTELAERATNFRNPDGRYPWRLLFHLGTGLPAFVRLRLHRPFSDDDQTALGEAANLLGGQFELSYRGWSGAIFGQATEFGRSYTREGKIIHMVSAGNEADPNARRTSMRHFAWRQRFQGLPVIGGSVRLHEGVRDERVAITSSFFPITDQEPSPLDGAVWNESVLRLRAAQALMQHFVQYRTRSEQRRLLPIYFLTLLAATGGGDLAILEKLLEQAAVTSELMRGEIDDILSRLRAGDLSVVEAVNLLREHVGIESGPVPVPIEGSDEAILPFDGAYHLIRRYAIAVPNDVRPEKQDAFFEPNTDVWYLDIDVHTGEALDGPWQAALGAPYFSSSQETLTGHALGEAADVLDAAALAELNQIITNANLLTNAAATDQTRTVAVQALTVYRHLTQQCGADSARLQGYAGNTPGLRVVSGGSTKFMWGSAYNPKRIRFDTSPELSMSTGEVIYNQASDPEVIGHEFIHGFLWLLDQDPWDLPSTINPFASALHEGYAMYLSRSIAAADTPGEQDKPWARGAYREKKLDNNNNWLDRWALSRTGNTVGADLLPAPNIYPSGIFNINTSDPVEALRHYDVGMVWARALWDLRQVLGPAEADWLAVQAYPYLHGYISSFELAAEGLMEADRQQRPLIDLTDATLPIWTGRGVCAGQGIVAFAEANGTLIAGSDAGILEFTGVWQLQTNNLNGQTLRGIVALAADTGNNRFYAAAHLPTAATASAQREWTPGIFARAANGAWSSLGNWAADTQNATPLALFFLAPNTLLVATARGVYQKPVDNAQAWQLLGFTKDMLYSLTGYQSGASSFVRGCGPNRMLQLQLGDPAAAWLPENNPRAGGLGSQATERLIRLVTCNNRAFLGALSGFYEVESNWHTAKITGPTGAVLALAAHETAANKVLYVAASNGVFSGAIPGAPTAVPNLTPLPELKATVISLHVSAAGDLYAGTQSHGIWKLEGGAWTQKFAPSVASLPAIGANQRALLRVHEPVAAPGAQITLPAGLNLIRVAQPGLPLHTFAPAATYSLAVGDVLLLVEAGALPVAINAVTVNGAGDISIT